MHTEEAINTAWEDILVIHYCKLSVKYPSTE